MTEREKEALSNFTASLSQLHITLSEAQMQQLLRYFALLIEKNRVMNLTAITEFDEVLQKHFLDSLSLARAADLSEPIRVIDVGTGAGFPGMVLKIAFPQLSVTLADAKQKRIGFLDEVIKALGLCGVKTIHGRAEDLSHTAKLRGQFDLAVSRAVANLSTLSEYCLPFVRIGGRFIAYKSADCEEEITRAARAADLLGGEILPVVSFSVGENRRSLIPVKKVADTPDTYPRKAGLPAKNPL